MGKFVDLTGQMFDRLTVIKRAGSDPWNSVLWLCECSCGNTTIVSSGSLRKGSTRSCGCLQIDFASAGISGKKHGLSNTGAYSSWANMCQRCFNPKNKQFKDYGGRGITVCDEWKDSVEAFYIDMGERPENTSLDRIDVNGNYEPSNCRWATKEEQANNSRRNRIITYLGESYTIASLAKQHGFKPALLRARLERGWSVEDALLKPIKKS